MSNRPTTPTAATIVLNEIDAQYVDRIVIDPAIVGTVDGQGQPNGSAIDLEKSGINYNVVDVDINGRKMKAQRRPTLFWEDIPPAGRTLLRDLINMLYSDAQQQGMLLPGDSSDDV